MGMSIDIHMYDYAKLCEQITDIAGGYVAADRTAKFFIDKVLPNFGVVANDKFITLWNEYYEDYNSGLELMTAVDLYFGIEGVFLDGYKTLPHANAREVLDELGVESIDIEED